MGYVLHVVPGSMGNAKKRFAGSTKDVLGRVEYFEHRAVPVRMLESAERSDAQVRAALRAMDLSACLAVLFEYESYVGSMEYLRESYPQVLRLVRAHNANLPHMLDQFRGRVRMLAESRLAEAGPAFEDVNAAVERARIDRRCAALADRLFPICEWEAQYYWKALSSTPDNVRTVPYYTPTAMTAEVPPGKRRNLLVLMMGAGGAMTPLLYDAGRNGVAMVNALPTRVIEEWEFVISGSLKPPDVLGPLGVVQPTGLLDSPLPLLAAARAVAVLSDLGMGFKTKLLEAISAGCWVIVTPDLYRRLPSAVRDRCRAVPVGDIDALARALAFCRDTETPRSDPNAMLREEAFAALDAVFLPLLEARSAAAIRGQASRADPGEVRPREAAASPLSQRGLQIWDEWIAPAIPQAQRARAIRVFEYAAGSAPILVTAARAGYRCAAADASPALLDEARARLGAACRLSRIDRHGRCDLPDGSADFAYCVTGLAHLESMSELRRAIAEIARILTPGGSARLRFRLAQGRAAAGGMVIFPGDRRARLVWRRTRFGLPLLSIRVGPFTRWRGVALTITQINRLLHENGLVPVATDVQQEGEGGLVWITGQRRA